MLFSDTLTRVAFLLFILLVPVGFHHQFVDPGISGGLKFAVAGVTFAIFFPSLMTAFSVMYALEIGGRRRGGMVLLLSPNRHVARAMSLYVGAAVHEPRYLVLGKRISVFPGEQTQVRRGRREFVFQRPVPISFNSMASCTML